MMTFQVSAGGALLGLASRFRVVQAPDPFTPNPSMKALFLSGSGPTETSGDWRMAISTSLSHLPITILNPWRDDWNSSWTEDITCDNFKQQTNWELDMMWNADVIAVYLDQDTQAPISLLELGLFASSGKVVVCCQPGYWKRGNVQVVCERFKIELCETFDDLLRSIERKLAKPESHARGSIPPLQRKM